MYLMGWGFSGLLPLAFLYKYLEQLVQNQSRLKARDED